MDSRPEEREECVLLSVPGCKKKRISENHSKIVAKKWRHSGEGKSPFIACNHRKEKACRAASLSTEELAVINRVFYSTADKVQQDAALLSYMDILPVKRRRRKVDNQSKHKTRALTVNYFVYNEAGKIPVCKAAFMSIFGIKKDRLCHIAQYWMRNGVTRPENRGGTRNADEKEARRQLVREHIESFTCRSSSYAGRGTSPGRKYLPAELTVKKMHQLFCSQYKTQVSYHLYYSVFMFDLNLAFGHPSKDTCGTCVQLRLALKNPEITHHEKRKVSALYLVHRRRVGQFYRLLSAVEETFTISFDLLQHLVMPASQSNYSGPLYQYVFGIVHQRLPGLNQRKEDVHLFTWLQNENKDGGNMAASALHYYLGTVVGDEVRDRKTLRLFSDLCFVQNKNIHVLSTLFALKKDKLENVRVNYTFPIRGHSFLPPDCVFARVEQEIKKNNSTLLTSDFLEMMHRHGQVHVYGEHWQCHDCPSSPSLNIGGAKVLEICADKLGFKNLYGGNFRYRSVLEHGEEADVCDGEHLDSTSSLDTTCDRHEISMKTPVVEEHEDARLNEETMETEGSSLRSDGHGSPQMCVLQETERETVEVKRWTMRSGIQCLYCRCRYNSMFSFHVHVGSQHPLHCEDVGVGRLGKVVFYQRTAKLFHCFLCFFTSKDYGVVFEHLLVRHCIADQTPDRHGKDPEQDTNPDLEIKPDDDTATEHNQEQTSHLNRKRTSVSTNEHEEEENLDIPEDSQDFVEEQLAAVERYSECPEPPYYNCRLCKWRCKTRHTLLLHVNCKHDVPKPHVCSECSDTFMLKSLLTGHTHIHHRQEVYRCPYCRFQSSIQSLHQHLSQCRGEETNEDIDNKGIRG